VKVDVPCFDEKKDVTTFSNWLVAMEDYFDWYDTYSLGSYGTLSQVTFSE